MDALDLLIADHNRVRGMFARFKEARDAGDSATMGRIVADVHRELDVHTTLEERSFYPSVREVDEELASLIAEGVEEHHVADLIMAEADDLKPGDPTWVAKITVLIENVEHHLGEEESDMFPQVRKVTDAATREEWGRRMERMKVELGAPTSADADNLTVDELRGMAADQQIPGRSTMDRAELAATVDLRRA